MARVTAIVTAYNRADFVTKCVASLLDSADADMEVRVIVMDNGSSDNTGEAARSTGDRVFVERTEDNRPVVGVINRGFKIALADEETDYIIIMNDDTEFMPGALRKLIEACEAHPNSILTPLQLNYKNPERIDDRALAGASNVRDLVEDAIMGRPLRQVYPVRTMIGAGMLAKRETWENIGPFDELFLFYGSDDDYCTRAQYLGYSTYLVPASHLLHAHGGLVAAQSKQNKADYLRAWSLRTQSHYLFRLKDFRRPLWLAYLGTAAYAMGRTCGCITSLWPVGAMRAATLYLRFLGQYADVGRARQRDFDPSRKILT